MRPRQLTPNEIRSRFGAFVYMEAPQTRGRILVDATWRKKSIVSAWVPELYHLAPRGITCHREIAAVLRSVFVEIQKEGLIPLILTYDGCFVPRHMGWDPKRALSVHSWGIAIDLNARWNGYGQKPAAWNARGTVRPLVPIFERHGFVWGGWWEGKVKDGMHFEYGKLAEA